MRRSVTDTPQLRTYQLTLENGQWLSVAVRKRIGEPIEPWMDRIAWQTLAADLRKRMPKIIHKPPRKRYDVIEGGFFHDLPPPKKPIKAPSVSPWGWLPPKGVA